MHLDHILIGDTRLKWALSDLRETIRRDSAAIRENAVTETQERLSPPLTPDESAREAQSKVHEFRRLQSAAYHASGDERKAARKAFDEYRARESKHYTTPGEDRRHARDIHEETQQQPSSPQTDEERRCEAQSKAHEFRRLQSAAYNATGDERIAATEGVRRLSRARVQKEREARGKETSDPQEEVQEPENAFAVSRAVGWAGAPSPRPHASSACCYHPRPRRAESRPSAASPSVAGAPLLHLLCADLPLPDTGQSLAEAPSRSKHHSHRRCLGCVEPALRSRSRNRAAGGAGSTTI